MVELQQEVAHWRQAHAECTTSLITADRRIARLQQAETWTPAHDEYRNVDFPVAEGYVYLLRYPEGGKDEYVVLPDGYAICKRPQGKEVTSE